MKARGGALREIREMFAPYCFHKKDTVPVHKLESGDYGYSNVSRHTISNRSIVIKQVYFNDMEPARLSRLCSEYILLMRATNRYLNPPVGFIFNNPIIVATEEQPRGNLATALRNGILSPTEKTKIALGVAYAMRRLHKMHIVHGDLKSKNVLLGDDFRPLVSDFAIGSIAHHLKAPIQYRVTDPFWCAPEVLRGEAPTEKSDVYSFGALLAELYNTRTQTEGAYFTAHVDDDFLPTGAPLMLQAVVKLCTNVYPQKRPTFKRIYRLFKNCICFFEGTDLCAIREEVALIKADRHKSHSRFNPLVPVTLPSREDVQALITKSDAINEQKRAKRLMAKSKASIDVREARLIQLPRRERATSQSARGGLKLGENNGLKMSLGGAKSARTNSDAFSMKLSLGGLSNLGVSASPKPKASQMQLGDHSNLSATPKAPKAGSMQLGDLSNLSLASTPRPKSGNMQLGNFGSLSMPSSPKPANVHAGNLSGISLGLGRKQARSVTMEQNDNTDASGKLTVKSMPSIPKVDQEDRFGPHPTRLPAHGMPLGLQTSYKGRISVSDRFKTVDDADGKNYLRLPRRLRKTTHFAPSVINAPAAPPKERLFKSTTSRVSNVITIKATKMNTGIKRMTKSLLCIQVILKQRSLSFQALCKPDVLPTGLSLSKQVMPLIRPDLITTH